MAIDALSLALLLKEQSSVLINGKINKISMPEKDEIILTIYNKKTYKLLISCNNNVNRVLLTSCDTKNPTIAPSFCMLLRKYLIGGTIKSIYQQPYERVVDYAITTKDELGYQFDVHLIFEPTGRDSNLVLTDENYKIIDSLRHFSCDLQTARIILPNATYRFFLPQNKLLPTQFDEIDLNTKNCTDPRNFLTENVLGICSTTAQEIHSIAYNKSISIGQATKEYLNKLNDEPNPFVLYNNKIPVDVLPFEYLSKKGDKKFYSTLNEAHDDFYTQRNTVQRFNEKSKSVHVNLKNAIARTEKKLGIQQQAILEAKNNTESKLYGDLILANIYLIKKNMSEVQVVNYYDETMPTIKIPLDPQLSPQQNAQAYYKKYAKQKSSLNYNTKLVEENTQLLTYLKSIAKNLTFCETDQDLIEIVDELSSKKIIKNNINNSKQKNNAKQKEVKPLHYVIEGYDVYVGKNNVQNDYVTFKLAKPKDLWLHAQKIHSSHAVIVANNSTIPEIVILKTAQIVANYSEATQGTKIPIDYCLKKFVKKPPSSPLGFVIYTDFNTILVDPDKQKESLID